MRRDDLNQHEQGYIGDVARLEIPLQSVSALRRVAEELRGLATRLDCLAVFADDKPGVVMLEARMLVRGASKRLTEIRGRGRPKRSRHKF